MNIKLGSANLQLVSEDRQFDPTTGVQNIQLYEGDEDALNAFAASCQILGAKARVSQLDGPVYRATVTWGEAVGGGSGSLEDTKVDTWERSVELRQVDIRANVKMLRDLGGGDPAVLAQHYFAAKRLLKDQETGVSSGSVVGPLSNEAYAIYTLLARGADTSSQRTFTLRRRRNIPIRFIAQSQVTAIETAYTTASLVSAFAIPAAIASKLPADPPAEVTPPFCTWGWLERQDTSEITIASGRAEEVKDWVFGAISTILYDVV